MRIRPNLSTQKPRSTKLIPKVREGAIWIGLLLPLALYGVGMAQRSARTSLAPQPLFQGITYRRLIEGTPRPYVVHLFDIDLSAAGLRPLVTPAVPNAPVINADGQPLVTQSQRTASFLREHGLQLAVNANFFYPFEELAPWNYEPDEGDLTAVIGVSISDGQSVSPMHPRYSVLCFSANATAQIVWQENCPADTQQAVSGQPLWIAEGDPPEEMAFVADKLKSKKAYPLTLAALNPAGDRLWLLISDGKQPLYSEGMTIKEASVLLQSLGATTAVQLDGGGSATAVVAGEDGPEVLNAVIHAKIPGYERPVANNLGFYANPLQP
ncbi:MAG: phosphodiester glycosidase family protein [Cyanobacteria bacterium J06621_11]